jgi:hypothetical protein
MAKAGMIAPSDLELVHATNSVDDAIAHIRRKAIEPFGLRPARRLWPHWRWLGERGLRSRYHLLELSRLPLPPDIKCSQSEHGPYVVLQSGAMPGDPYSNSLDFLLTKEGTWLPMFAFLQLPEQERYELCIFRTAAEAIQQLERLAGRAKVDEERMSGARHTELFSTQPKKLDAPDEC